MAKRGVKLNAKNVLKAAMAGKIEKRNITFRLESGLLDEFVKIVDGQGVSANSVVETLISQFVQSFKDDLLNSR